MEAAAGAHWRCDWLLSYFRPVALGPHPHVEAVVEIVEAVTTAKRLKRDGPDTPDSG
jgi:hypothetical protein